MAIHAPNPADSGKANFKEAAARIVQLFLDRSRHFYLDPARHYQPPPPGPRGITQILSYGSDARRNAGPLDYTDATKGEFSDMRSSPGKLEVFELEDGSRCSSVLTHRRSGKAVLFSRVVNPEPLAEHYADLFELAFALGRKRFPSLVFVNLPGSGASLPQQFHAQIAPLGYRESADASVGSVRKNFLGALIENLSRHRGRTRRNGIALGVVERPLWGVRLTFPDRCTPARIGRMVHEAIHHAVRYRGQLAVSYNLYVESARPHSVVVLFRDPGGERPMAAPGVLEWLARRPGGKTADGLRNSLNRHWRWGAMECLGGLFARDDRFGDTATFNAAFWKRVYRTAGLDPGCRRKVLHEIAATVDRFAPHGR